MSSVSRDRSIDAVRAVAIGGVVAGHWLVTGLVLTPAGLRTASPLAAMPYLAPVSWILQTLGLLFFAGGYAAACSRPHGPTPENQAPRTAGARPGRTRVRRLTRSVIPLLATYALLLVAGAAAGIPNTTLRTTATLLISPLWFLLPYLAFTAATRPLHGIVRRLGPAAALPLVPVVAATDAGLLPAPAAVAAVWLIPWLLGMALADRDRAFRPGRSPAIPYFGAALFFAGATALTALIHLANYPPSAVGVPGDGRSNLSPPSLLAVALAITQTGVFLMIRGPLQKLLRHDSAYRPVAAINGAAVPVYLTHQTVLLGLAGVIAVVNPVIPGLLGAPDGPSWAWHRAAWLPVLGALLALITRSRARLS